jgi:hypothetical protein
MDYLNKNSIRLYTLGGGIIDTITMKRLDKDFFKISNLKSHLDTTKYMFHFYNRKNAFYGNDLKVNVDSITDDWIKSSFEIDTIEMPHILLDSIVYDSSNQKTDK